MSAPLTFSTADMLAAELRAIFRGFRAGTLVVSPYLSAEHRHELARELGLILYRFDAMNLKTISSMPGSGWFDFDSDDDGDSIEGELP